MTSPRLLHQAQPKAAPCRKPRGQQGICGRGIRSIRDLNGVVQLPLVTERPLKQAHTGRSRASQESRNGKASQVQELEPPPTPNCHGCVRRQSVMKCMTSRCAAWLIKDDLVREPSMQQLPLPGREAQSQGPKGNAQLGAPATVCNAGDAHQPRGGVGQASKPLA